ncbi:hypothetical protein [uncultured Shewanella sp.]|uniref:helix-turn-helix transcriptional regulator n=1 Tax=Shewanella atlantica TaxID=271099 RepID=UPI00262B5166|nr:hypothetical protein [uncultured Shewanella sp.]
MARGTLEYGLTELLRQSREHLGVADICYCYDINSPDDWRCRIKDGGRMMKLFEKRRQLFASSAKALNLWQKKRFYYSKMTEEVTRVFSHPVYVWPKSKMPTRLQLCIEQSGVVSLVTITVPCRFSPELSGRFMLLLESQQQLEALQEHLEDIENHLTELQMKIVINYGDKINPLVDYNIVTPVSALILNYLAAGEDREEVSQKLKLTMRGVDYHIGLLKQVLGARTIAQLIYRAGQCRLV